MHSQEASRVESDNDVGLNAFHSTHSWEPKNVYMNSGKAENHLIEGKDNSVYIFMEYISLKLRNTDMNYTDYRCYIYK